MTNTYQVIIRDVITKNKNECRDEKTTIRLYLRKEGDKIVFSQNDNTSDRLCKVGLAMLALASSLGLFSASASTGDLPWDWETSLKSRLRGEREIPFENSVVLYAEISLENVHALASAFPQWVGAIKRAEIREVSSDTPDFLAQAKEMIMGQKIDFEGRNKSLNIVLPGGQSPEAAAALAAAIKTVAKESETTEPWQLTECNSVIRADGSGEIRMTWHNPPAPKPVAYSNAPTGIGGRRTRRVIRGGVVIG